MITFTKLVNRNIFNEDFTFFKKNNTFEFSPRIRMVVLYGPNGVGKTSLVKALKGEEDTSVAFDYQGVSYTDPSSIFHVISDQNNRNVIHGKCGDFLLGDRIQEEEQLNKNIDGTFEVLAQKIISTLKKYGITAKSSPLLSLITDNTTREILGDFANNRSKGKNSKTIEKLQTLSQFIEKDALSEEEQRQLKALQDDIAKGNKSLINKIKELARQRFFSVTGFKRIEEYDEAIKILSRFEKTDDCIVCDHPIKWAELLQRKTSSHSDLIAKVNDEQRGNIEAIISSAPSDDPFSMKEILIKAVDSGNVSKLMKLCAQFVHIEKQYRLLVLSEIAAIVKNEETLITNMEKLNKLLGEKLELSDEDELYIRTIIRNSMDKELQLERNSETKNIAITIDKHNFLEAERSELPLSTGEQNFLSLSFEFLRAKKQKTPIIVIDDPISSFDSIYKNKVVYSLVKILEDKHCLVLTHTVELLRLLEAQYSNSYSLYLLNNIVGAENGFIKINESEKKLIISLKDLLQAFRGDVLKNIKDEKLFLLSMIPFLRGYSSILGSEKFYDRLTSLMHIDVDNNGSVNLAEIYEDVIKPKSFKFAKPCEASVQDILSEEFQNQEILDSTTFPLLNKTLKHSLTYLYLRLTVEKKLREKYPVETQNCKQLGEIINKAFKDKDSETICNRVFLTSRKTLLNEFNHFEGNLSIFQPAIDISDQALMKEKKEIEDFVARP